MTPGEVLPFVVAAVAGGAIAKVTEPLVALLRARQHGQVVRAEAHRIESEASATPFDQATRIIVDLRGRVEVLEKRCDEEREERESLIEKLSECMRLKALLEDRQTRAARHRGAGAAP